MTETQLSLPDRITTLLDHLGIQRAHIAARMQSDWHGLARQHPERIASLSLLCGGVVDAHLVHPLAERLYVMSAAEHPLAAQVTEAMRSLPRATYHELPATNTHMWTDIAADFGEEIQSSMLPFITTRSGASFDAKNLRDGEQGEVAGITYAIHGSGEPLLLFPLTLAPSGWTPLLDSLRKQFTAIVIGGPELGVLPLLERRAQSAGYRRMQRNLFDVIALRPGETVLEVGCGSGAVCRWLAAQTSGANPVTGVDINGYLLGEAVALTAKSDQSDTISFQQGNAHALPFPDNYFDVTFATTVMEEVNADQMLAELIRVTKPGGRVGVIVRAMDIGLGINIPVRTELRALFEDRPDFDEGEACASASLYRRFRQSPLTNVTGWPQLAEFMDPAGPVEGFLMGPVLAQLNDHELAEWRSEIDQAAADGTFFITWPHHCAVGMKPR